MIAAEAQLLLHAWESGAARSAPIRALLMLAVAAPQEPPDALAELSVGHRNAELLSLRERLFGPTVDGLTRCPSCDESIQLTFAVDDVRAEHAQAGATFRAIVGDHDFVALGFEVESQSASKMLFIFYDQDSHFSSALGSRIVKALPRPSPSLSAATRPPCFSTIERTMKSPSPVPLMRIITGRGTL